MKRIKLFRAFIAVLSVISIGFVCIFGTACSGRYNQNTQTITVVGGGTLKAFAEMNKKAYTETSGDNRIVKYRVTGEYTGDYSVEEIKQTWRIAVSYQRQTGSSFSAGITAGTHTASATIGAGETTSNEILSTTLHFTNSNGINSVYYGPSNFVMWPEQQVYSYSLQNTVQLKLVGHATPFSVTAAV